MKISKDAVVSIHYKLTNNEGETIDSSEGKAPLVYLQGYNNIIPGLENQLDGKELGEKLVAKVAPADAYGEQNDQLIQQVPKAQFDESAELEVGMQFEVNTENAPLVFTIKAIDGDLITVDGNHPLAGVELNFDVEVVAIREASAEEIAHGHVHGEGGHNH